MRTKRSFPAPVAGVVLVVTAMVLAACGSSTTADEPKRGAAADTVGGTYNKFMDWDGDPEKVLRWEAFSNGHGTLNCGKNPPPSGGPNGFSIEPDKWMPLSPKQLVSKGFPADDLSALFWPATWGSKNGMRALNVTTNPDGVRDWTNAPNSLSKETRNLYLPNVGIPGTTSSPGYACTESGDKAKNGETLYVGVNGDATTLSSGAWSLTGKKVGFTGTTATVGVLKMGDSNRCVTAPNDNDGATVQLKSCGGENMKNQQFEFVPSLQDPAVRKMIRKQGTNMCLDVKDAIFRDRTPVQLWKCTDHNAQSWQLVEKGVRSWWNSGGPEPMCLDNPHGSTDENTQLWLWQCNDGTAQAFARVDLRKLAANCSDGTDTPVACVVTKLASGNTTTTMRVGLVGAYQWTLPVRLTVNNNTTSIVVINSSPSNADSSGTAAGTVNLVPNDGKSNVQIPGKASGGTVATDSIGFLRTFNTTSTGLSLDYLYGGDAAQTPDVPELKAVKDKPFRMKLRVILANKTALLDSLGGQTALDDCVAGKASTTVKVSATDYSKWCGAVIITITAGTGGGVRAADATNPSTETSYNNITFALTYPEGATSLVTTSSPCLEDTKTAVVNNRSPIARSLGKDGFMDLRLGLMNCNSGQNPLTKIDSPIYTN